MSYIIERLRDNHYLWQADQKIDGDVMTEAANALEAKDAEIERLRSELKDIHDAYRVVMDETCDDEKHCTCVPVLRSEIERLRALCKASYYLLMGSDAIYDARGDVGPTHWALTCDRLKAQLREFADE